MLASATSCVCVGLDAAGSTGHYFRADKPTTGVTAATAAKAVTKPDAKATSPVSGAVDITTAKEQHGLDAGSPNGLWRASIPGCAAKPAKVNAPGQKDDTAPAKQPGTETKDQSTSNLTDATKSDATRDDTSKGDTTTPSGQSTSTSTSSELQAYSVSDPFACAQSGAGHPGLSAAKDGHAGKAGRGGK
jgi:hypothetical protein